MSYVPNFIPLQLVTQQCLTCVILKSGANNIWSQCLLFLFKCVLKLWFTSEENPVLGILMTDQKHYSHMNASSNVFREFCLVGFALAVSILYDISFVF